MSFTTIVGTLCDAHLVLPSAAFFECSTVSLFTGLVHVTFIGDGLMPPADFRKAWLVLLVALEGDWLESSVDILSTGLALLDILEGDGLNFRVEP